jgi:hypothetical protein
MEENVQKKEILSNVLVFLDLKGKDAKKGVRNQINIVILIVYVYIYIVSQGNDSYT